MRNYVISLFVLALLSACGGSGTAGNSSQQSGQQKQLVHSQKAVASDYQSVVQGLYVSYFGRPADPGGLENFERALLNLNAPTDIRQLRNAAAANPAIEALIAGFGNSPESARLYGDFGATNSTANTEAFVKAVFQNVVNRPPQPAGLIFWGDAIAGGRLSRGDAALAIMTAALVNQTTQGLADAHLIGNRLSVAAYFTDQVAQQNKTNAYSGSAAAGNGHAVLAAVTAATDVASYDNSVQAYVAAMSTPSANNVTYQLENMSATGSTDGSVIGSFTYDWTSLHITAFSIATPLGNLSSASSGNSASVAAANGYTGVRFTNGQTTLTLYYAGTPGAGQIGFFNGALCTTNYVCTAGTSRLPISSLTSSVWSSDEIWVPNLVWQPNLIWVPNVVWVSNWVWVSDMECNATDSDGNCTAYVDDGYYQDDGSYADQGGFVDEGSFVDDGVYVDQGGYPNDNITAGMSVLVP
ncbi:MAG TPA: DUF4214 domain-containing protein [Burkholderiaceae bacterium]|jgi:hypothetical protein